MHSMTVTAATEHAIGIIVPEDERRAVLWVALAVARRIALLVAAVNALREFVA